MEDRFALFPRLLGGNSFFRGVVDVGSQYRDPAPAPNHWYQAELEQYIIAQQGTQLPRAVSSGIFLPAG
jgi:hypothetical protein